MDLAEIADRSGRKAPKETLVQEAGLPDPKAIRETLDLPGKQANPGPRVMLGPKGRKAQEDSRALRVTKDRKGQRGSAAPKGRKAPKASKVIKVMLARRGLKGREALEASPGHEGLSGPRALRVTLEPQA